MVKGFGVVRQIQRDIHNVHLQYYHNGLKIREMGGLDGHAFWNIIIYYYHVPLLSPSLPPAQFEAGDCSLGREGGSTPCRQQLQQLQQQQPQHTLGQKTWNHKSLVSTSLSSPSSPSSPSFPSSPILKLSPLSPPSPSFSTLKPSPFSCSSSPTTKLCPPSPTSAPAAGPLDGDVAKVDPTLPLEKQR